MDILAAYREVGSYRGAAEICGTTHKTVRRVVERHNAGGAAPAAQGPRPQLRRGPRAGRRAGRASHGRISAKRLLPAARAAGYAGSARNFRRLVAEVKAAWRAGHHRGRRPAVWTPGDTLVIDWGAEGRLHVFCAVLAWSRFRFVRFAADEKAATTLGAAGRVLRDPRRGAQDGAGRPDGLPEGRGGRQRGGADGGVRAVRHALRVPARFLRGGRPGVERNRGAPGRLCQARPDRARPSRT